MKVEYIRHNTAAGEVRALDDWFQSGAALAARSHREAGNGSDVGVHNGLFAGPDQTAVMFSVRPSADGIGRLYPFVVFEVAGLVQGATSETPALPLAAGRFFGSAPTIVGEAWAEANLPRLLGRVDRVADSLREGDQSFDRPASEFLKDLYPDGPEAARVTHLRAVVELMREVQARSASRVSWGLRLPFGTQAPLGALAWWLTLARRVIGNSGWAPCAIWAATADGPVEGLLFFRQPPVNVAAYLVSGQSLHEAVVDPADHVQSVAPANLESVRTPVQLIDWLVAA
jgi:hypothetical protein